MSRKPFMVGNLRAVRGPSVCSSLCRGYRAGVRVRQGDRLPCNAGRAVLATRRRPGGAVSGPIPRARDHTMADNNNGNAAPAPAQPQSISVLAQYVKDLSFENPGAPQSLRARTTSPNISIGVNVQAGQVTNGEAEVSLSLDVRASENDTVIFAIE